MFKTAWEGVPRMLYSLHSVVIITARRHSKQRFSFPLVPFWMAPESTKTIIELECCSDFVLRLERYLGVKVSRKLKEVDQETDSHSVWLVSSF